jgi:hypothetical protein
VLEDVSVGGSEVVEVEIVVVGVVVVVEVEEAVVDDDTVLDDEPVVDDSVDVVLVGERMAEPLEVVVEELDTELGEVELVVVLVVPPVLVAALELEEDCDVGDTFDGPD